nr:glycosyltransferase family 4 protein [Chryseosolibacter histidini]
MTVGGTERTAAVLANYLVGLGDDVSILVMYKKPVFYELHPSVKLIEPPASVRQKLGRVMYMPYVLRFLRTELRKGKPDVVFSLGYMALTLFSSLGLPTKVVISGRSSPSRVRFPNNKMLDALYRFSHSVLKQRVNGIIAQTEAAAQAYRTRYACPIRIIPNFLREIKEHRVERKDQIVTVGRCVREKGQHFLIQAFAKVNAPGWKLVIVGDGPKRAGLEQLAQELGLQDRVHFAGFQQDVDLFLAQSKIFALTSVIEGFPNALIEAMSTPLACVSFNCEAGPSEIIHDGENGYLVEVGDVDTLAKRLQALALDSQLRERIQQKASEARQLYAIGKIGDDYRRFFGEIASAKRN